MLEAASCVQFRMNFRTSGRTAMYWEMYQQTNIHDARVEAANASSVASQAADRGLRLERKIDTLALCCQAMWELLRDNTKLSEEDIERKVMEIDLRDGHADGKIGPRRRECPACSRALNPRHSKCIYCGCEIVREHQFGV